MKRIGFIILALAGMMAAGCSATKPAASSEAQAAQQQHVDNMLQNRLYKVDFTRAYPMSGPAFALTYPYYMSVIGDRVESFLPYFGRAWSIPYGGGEGLRFNAPITGYTVKEGKKGRTEISFNARTDEDSYLFSLEVYPGGSSYLTVSPLQKQTISFDGKIDLDPEFELKKVAE